MTRFHRSVLTGLAVLALGLAFSTGVASAERLHVFERSFGEPGSGVGQLEDPTGVAVNDTTGDVYVADSGNDRVDDFGSDGIFVRAWGGGVAGGVGFQVCTVTCQKGVSGVAPGEFERPEGIAVDNSGKTAAEDPSVGDVYVVDTGHDLVDRFSAAGIYEGHLSEACEVPGESLPCKEVPFVGVAGVAVNPEGDVWVLEGEGGRVDEFNPTGEQVGGFKGGWEYAHAITLDAAGHVYVGRGPAGSETHPVERCTATGECSSLTELVSIGLAFDTSSGGLFADEGTSIATVDSASGAVLESFGKEHLTAGAGIAVSPDATVYVAGAAAGDIDVLPLAPLSPAVRNESVSEVTGDSVTFEAEVKPSGEAGEPGTEYYFEYTTAERFQREGFTGASSAPVSPATLAPSFEFAIVSTHVQGLSPGTPYRFRAVAVNSHKPAAEGELNAKDEEVVHTFSTRGTGVFGLPDGRAWELVSPADKHGALLEPIGEGWVIQAARDGGGITYVANAPTESAPAGYDNFEQVLSTRTASGWSSQDITPPQSTATKLSVGAGNEYRFFSEDLSRAVVQPFGPFTPCVNEEGAGQPCLSTEASEQTAFLRTNFYNGNVSEPCTSGCYTPLVTGAAGHANVPEGTVFGQISNTSGDSCPPDLICGPEFVGAAPDGSDVLLGSLVSLTVGGTPGVFEWRAGVPAGEQLRQPKGQVLSDGAEVFSSEGHLVFEVPATGEVLRLDAAQGVSEPAGGGEATLLYASSDASRVFFSDPKQLTGAPGGGVYACRIVKGEGGLSCELELTSLEGAGVFAAGALIGASEDGSYLYFHNGDQLLVEHDEASGWTQTLIATVSGADENDWQVDLARRTSRVSADGGWFAFMSQVGLTGYDNRDAVSGVPDEEVFLFDAARPVSEGVAGVVDNPLCASCDPTGARPHGVEYGRGGNTAVAPELPLAGGFKVWEGTAWLAANVPGWTPYALQVAVYQSRYLSDSGRLFFNSSDALVPKDVNGTGDVYEFEPVGVPAGEHECTPPARPAASSTSRPTAAVSR